MEQQTHHLKHSTPVTLSKTCFLLRFFGDYDLQWLDSQPSVQTTWLYPFSWWQRMLGSPEHRQTNPRFNHSQTERFATTIIKTQTLLCSVCSLLSLYICLKFPRCVNHILSQTTAPLLWIGMHVNTDLLQLPLQGINPGLQNCAVYHLQASAIQWGHWTQLQSCLKTLILL